MGDLGINRKYMHVRILGILAHGIALICCYYYSIISLNKVDLLEYEWIVSYNEDANMKTLVSHY